MTKYTNIQYIGIYLSSWSMEGHRESRHLDISGFRVLFWLMSTAYLKVATLISQISHYVFCDKIPVLSFPCSVRNPFRVKDEGPSQGGS